MVGTGGCATAMVAAALGAGRSPRFCGGVGEGLAKALAAGAGACSACARVGPAPSNINARYLLAITTPDCISVNEPNPQRMASVQKRPNIFSASGRSVSIETMSCFAGTKIVIVAIPVGFFTAMHWVL